MYIRELTLTQFNDFANNFPKSNFHQTNSYALLKAEHDYEYEIIGYGSSDEIVAAAIVLVKLLDGYLYAYIPEGMLIDYDNIPLLKSFTESLYAYYKKENITFIKINPSIIVGEINPCSYTVKYNDNIKFIKKFEEIGYKKLNNNLNFESALPRITAIVDLEDLSFDKLKKNTKNKIRKAIRKGLSLEIGKSDDLNILNSFVKAKKNKDDFYYKDYYNIFKRDNSMDFFLISVNYFDYYNESKKAYEKELNKNETLNKKVQIKPSPKNVNKKMSSDKNLLTYKNDISISSKYINNEGKKYIAGALVVKHKDKATIVISGYDQKYKAYAPNYYLIYAILNWYKDKLRYVDLNGIAGDFTKTSKYYGLNQFKLGFNPKIYEYIGEFDLVINKKIYNHLIKKGLLDSEFKQ